MNKRVTCIGILDDKDLLKIKEMVSIFDLELCKVPYLVEDRKTNDTLPFHFTICVWAEENKAQVIEILKSINFEQFELIVDDIKIKSNVNDSFNLHFTFRENEKLRFLQNCIYNKLPNEKYNPNTFAPHISLHIDKDYDKIIEMQKKLKYNFKEFSILVKDIGLFEIYPAKQVNVANEKKEKNIIER